MRPDKVTRQTILPLGYGAYERSHPLPDYVRRAVWAILAGILILIVAIVLIRRRRTAEEDA